MRADNAPLFYRILRVTLRVFFYLLYRPFAWTYDWVAAAVSIGLWKDWVLAVLPYLDGPRVLELGHGPGHLQAAMHRKKLIAFGLDASPQMSRGAYRRLMGNGFLALLINGYAQNLPFKNHSFHQVVATFPTEYILDPRSLQEIRRVLEPEGQLIVLPLAWISGKRVHERAAAWLFRVTGQAPELDKRALEPLRMAGFHDLKAETIQVKSSQVLILRARA